MGIERNAAWVFIPALLTGPLALGILAVAVLAWIKPYWGILGRVYFSLNALLALALANFMLQTGLMTALFG